MTPAAARRRQDVGRTDSRGCWAGRREVLGSPVVSLSRVILVSACRRGAIYDARCRPQAARCRPHGQSRGVRRVVAGMLGSPVVLPCRATGVINGAPTFGVVVTDGWPQVVDVGWAVASVLGSPVVSPCRATGVINGAPTFGVVAMGWLAAGGGCWVSRRGRVLLRACLSCRGVRLSCRDVRRIGCCGSKNRAVRYTFYYI